MAMKNIRDPNATFANVESQHLGFAAAQVPSLSRQKNNWKNLHE